MKPSKIRILIADDHPVIRHGLASVLEGEEDMQIVAEAGDGTQAVELMQKHRPDIVLLDLRMPRLDGLAVIAQVRSLQLPSKVIVLTTFEQDVHRALLAGARAYLLKDVRRPMLLLAIRLVHGGDAMIHADRDGAETG